MLSRLALQEFQKIWLQEHKTPISEEEATEKAIALLTLFSATYRPIKKDWVIQNGPKIKR